MPCIAFRMLQRMAGYLSELLLLICLEFFSRPVFDSSKMQVQPQGAGQVTKLFQAMMCHLDCPQLRRCRVP
ncbi:hypothetical protein CSC94_23345 [Zhengella mangrovi]|uniref:Uncharacterized protein n=1 Tax=Zhengella mangrovi TaxID=1982044 RepID=A0A2G1QGI1_9HYPH|nr:hypothetical protein CSC94_23345 [Zhengella mangrovi]